MLKLLVTVVALVAIAPGGPIYAGQQPPPPVRGGADEQVQARYNIFVMEGVLERAVEHGADRLQRRVRRVMPDLLMLSGAAEARGFRLDGYGVFFDVAVPVLRRSAVWSFRAMIDEGGATGAALQQLKAAVERMAPDAREKANLMQLIKRIEMQVGPPPGAAPAVAGGQAAPRPGSVASLETEAPPPQQPAERVLTQEDLALEEDPSGAYEKEVVGALIDAMLNHSGSIGIDNDEWLTVAARDSEHRNRLTPRDYDLLTIVLRVKGSDLAAFRADRLTREEARKRVEVREF